MRAFLLVVSFALALATTTVRADNWPQWRGPQHNGVSQAPDGSLPVRWSKEENVVWRAPLPGPGGATPAIWGDDIFVTAADENELVLLCYSKESGKQKWRQVVSEGNREVRGDEGNSASPSPSTDGKHVWVFMANGELACYTVGGEEVWKFNIQSRYGKLKIAFGMTSTPLLDEGVLYLQLIHGEGNAKTREAKVVALKSKTGEEIWVQDRPSDAVAECEHSYASPTIYKGKKRTLLITHGADYVVAYDAASGKEAWRCGELNPKNNYNRTLRFVASPVATPKMIIVPSAKNGPVLALDPNGSGDLTNQTETRFWTRPKNTPDVPSPLVHDGLVYLCRENGVLICMDLETGKELYQERVHGQRHRASPVMAGGHLYLTARDGRVSVIQPGPEFKVVAQNDLEESLSASPAISDGLIILRTFDALYAIGGSK